MEGGQQRTVRIQVIPGPDLEDGTYFARLTVTSEEAGRTIEEIEAERQEGELVTRINYRFVQGFSINYRKGNVTTGIVVEDFNYQINESDIQLFSSLRRTGNSPFLGTLRASLINGSGQTVVSGSGTVGVAFEILNRLAIPLDEPLEAGSYIVRFEFLTDRADLNPSDIIRAEPVIFEQEITIP